MLIRIAEKMFGSFFETRMAQHTARGADALIRGRKPAHACGRYGIDRVDMLREFRQQLTTERCCRDDFVGSLLSLAAYVEREGLDYSIVNAGPIDAASALRLWDAVQALPRQ